MSHFELPPGDARHDLVPLEEYSSPSPFLYTGPPRNEAAEAEDPSGNALYYLHVVSQHKGALLLAAFLGAAMGYLSTLPQTPVYQARTLIEIQGINENFLNMRDVNPTSSGVSYSPEFDLQTQVKILQSQSLIDAVIAQVARQHPNIAEQPLSGQAGAWRSALGLKAPTAESERDRILRLAAESLKVRVQPNTRLIEAFVSSTDPQLAADFANTLADSYIEKSLEARWQATQNTGDWLTRQMHELKAKLEKSEDQLQGYARATGLQFTSEKDNVAEERLKQLQQELSRAQGDRIAKQSRYELAVHSPPDALPEVLDNSSLKEYQVKLADLRRQTAELSSTLTPSNPRVVKLEAQIVSLEATLVKERVNIVQRIKNEYEAAKRREALLSVDYATHAKFMSDQSGQIVHYNILKREVETTRQIYESMLQRVKEAGVAAALRASNVRIIDRAKAPSRPYTPRPVLSTTGGLLAGVLLSFAFVLVRQRADHSIHEPGESVPFLQASELGVIPSTEADGGSILQRIQRPDGNAGSRVLGDLAPAGDEAPMVPRDPALLSRIPSSAYADSFRAAVTSILFSGANGDRPKVLAVTSSCPGEGKTTVVSNLAIAFAEINRRVLLIDGDLRKPRIHQIFGVANNTGFSDCLREAGRVRILARETAFPNLLVLPSGSSYRTQLLYSSRLAQLIGLARDQVDIVLIDTPPMLQMADARALGRCSDAVILVIRAAHTTVEAATMARQRLAEDGIRVLGTILNDWNPKNTRAYGYGKYYKSYKRYYEGA